MKGADTNRGLAYYGPILNEKKLPLEPKGRLLSSWKGYFTGTPSYLAVASDHFSYRGKN